MSFNTNKYTRPVLVAELRKVSSSSFSSVSALAKAISPRAGTKSAKIAALKQFVANEGTSLNTILKTFAAPAAKVAVLTALT